MNEQNTSHIPSVLFVDDDERLLKALERMFRGRRHEWQMTFMMDAVGAADTVLQGSFDVLVTDLAMPGLSGLELVRKVSAAGGGPHCIILTGTADLQTAAEIINTVDVFRFYPKPCERDQLSEGISAALVERRDSMRVSRTGDGHGEAILNRLSAGVMVLSPRQEIIYMNQAAASLLAENDGLVLGNDQILRASSTGQTDQLAEVCTQAVSNGDNSGILAISVTRPTGREALRLMVSLMAAADGRTPDRIMLFILDPEKDLLPSQDLIRQFFELTHTESRLAFELLQGKRTEDIAEAMGITLSSTRTYIKRLMEKTGTNRQVDLVRLFLSLPQLVEQG